MGKRKSSKKPMAKKGNGKIGQSFDCVYCATDKSVNMTFSKPNNRWHLLCGACDATWDMDLMAGQKLEPIDVYYEWIDAAEEVRQKEEEARQSRAGPGSKRTTTSKRPPAGGRSRSASPTRNRNQRERSRSQERPREGGRAANEYDDEDAEGEEDEDYD